MLFRVIAKEAGLFVDAGIKRPANQLRRHDTLGIRLAIILDKKAKGEDLFLN